MGIRGRAKAGPAAKRAGRRAALNIAHVVELRAIIAEHRHASLDEVTRELDRRTGVQVCTATVRKALRAAGVTRVKPDRKAVAAEPVQPTASPRYGYTQVHRRDAPAQGYTTCLTDAEWALVADLFERPSGLRGTPARYDRRTMVDACCYVLRTGCAWRLLPTTFPAWPGVYKAFSRWAAAGTFERMQDRMREQWRARIGRNEQPTAAVIDAQSTRGSPQGGDTGFDAGKKVKGRKRHLVVDTLGLLLAVTITAASVQDRDAAPAVVAQACAKLPTLEKLYADGAYGGKCAQAIETTHGISVEIVRHPGNRNTGTWNDAQQPLWPEAIPKGFVVLPKRWVVERTHAWNERCRRLVMHHDRSSFIATAWVWLAEARILATRLAA